MVYAVDGDPERAIDLKPGIWHLEPGAEPRRVLQVNAQSDHPHPYVLDAHAEGDLLFVFATDADSGPTPPFTNASTWVAFDGETAVPLDQGQFADVPSPTTLLSIVPNSENVLTLTWRSDTLIVGVLN